jgi:predicted transcriptional regulator
MNIKADDWVAAFSDATQPRPGDSGNKTVNELAEAMGIDVRVVRIRIAKLLGQGRVFVNRERRQAIDGSYRMIPVYRLKDLEGKK